MLLGARGLTVKAKGLDCGYVSFKGGYNTNVAGRQHPLIFISVMTRPRSHGSDVSKMVGMECSVVHLSFSFKTCDSWSICRCGKYIEANLMEIKQIKHYEIQPEAPKTSPKYNYCCYYTLKVLMSTTDSKSLPHNYQQRAVYGNHILWEYS